MREIKFRAWHPDFGEMVYTNGESIFEKREFSLFVFQVGFSHYPETEWNIMQYTGLKDKEGKEIFEGDIGEIKTQSGRIDRFVVKWGVYRRKMASGWEVDIPGFCFWIDNFPSFPIVNNYNNDHDLDIISIIGNIYENPDLIPQT